MLAQLRKATSSGKSNSSRCDGSIASSFIFTGVIEPRVRLVTMRRNGQNVAKVPKQWLGSPAGMSPGHPHSSILAACADGTHLADDSQRSL
jgi:hypothetical protein